jgi:hypothetical protein
VVTACLEYLCSSSGNLLDTAPSESPDSRDDYGEDTEVDIDLEEAGADWLAEQGFDRKDQFSGDH